MEEDGDWGEECPAFLLKVVGLALAQWTQFPLWKIGSKLDGDKGRKKLRNFYDFELVAWVHWYACFYGGVPFYAIIICGGMMLLFLTGGILVLLPHTAPQLLFKNLWGQITSQLQEENMIFDWWHKVHAWCVSTYMMGEGECLLQDAEAHATSTIALFLVAGCPSDYSHLSHVIFRVKHLYVYLFLPTVWRFHFIKWSSNPEAVEISRVGLDMVGIRCLYMTSRLWNLTCSGFRIEPFYLFIIIYWED